ncbi:porin family protein [Pontibacter arcticus]|uniref:Outer membrane protein beta-barrel domain-containing protein n=1 Tax=Pontibacter arcticus TaxID=2080288 RepID=A0A364RIS8_9BACT|nr:hypothetical protein [Pontibacter arcticus]RAU84191.1 hypothetical protein DP923_03870 [Pontibacter arcticus]
MKIITKKSAILVPALLCLILNSYAQDAPTSEPGATAPYKTAIGFRTTFGGPSGLTSNLSIKHFFWKEAALELQAGQTGNRNTYHTTLSFIWQPQLISVSRLRPFAGAGIGVAGTNRDAFGERQNFEVRPVLTGVVGIEYTFPKAPISISADYRFHILGVNTHNYGAFQGGRANDFGISLKYTFR